MTRYERTRRRNKIRKAILALFFVVVPLTAVAVSFFFMNMYNRGSGIEATVNETSLTGKTAFKYNYDMEGKTLYRIELNSSGSFEEAEAFVKGIKAKKLNGFIIKEDGYKVIYGVFADRDEADKVMNSIESKVKGSINEFRLPGCSLKYNEDDNTFIQLVQAADQLIWEIIVAKSGMTHEMSLKIKSNTDSAFTEISDKESKLQKYLGYAQKLKVSNNQKVFRENFVMLLENILDYKVEADTGKDYYGVQESLMNQIEAYRRFIEKLLV